MKYMILSLLTSVIFLIALVSIIWFSSNSPSFSGVWLCNANGKSYEMVFTENQVKIEDETFDCDTRREGNLLVLILKNESGQTQSNWLTYVFEIKNDQMELMSIGFKPDQKMVLTKK